MPTTQANKAVLFTAFEPSGDDHAAAVIAELRRRRPGLAIHAWGGPKMQAAGAELVARTGADAVMGVPGLAKIREHRQINKNIAHWLAAHPEVVLHVPVDSPAANFPICKIAKTQGRRVVHLVAPQLWAWGPWRIKKLKRCTDLVLCLLPFEQEWFAARDVPARFIGHPLFDEALDHGALDQRASEMPRAKNDAPNIAILPGSRPAEIRRNFPVMLNAFNALRERHPGAHAVVAAVTETAREDLYARANLHGGWPKDMDVVVGETDAVIRWCDLALVVSGTVTLQIAKQAKPMVIMYKTNELMFKLVASRVLTTEHFALPNLIAGREAIPELVPYFKDQGQLIEAAEKLIASEALRNEQSQALREITSKFDGIEAAREAADAIEEVAQLPARRVIDGAPVRSTTPSA
ncbi:MAG: lipid-A-disaccharide synthase [Phycisphaerales bacterium]|nr:lipid-A-disaccharide synthase [Phycisphaerales bacterium]